MNYSDKEFDPTHCKEPVQDGVSKNFHQCQRLAVTDGYCKQHHPISIAVRQAKSMALFKAKLAKKIRGRGVIWP